MKLSKLLRGIFCKKKRNLIPTEELDKIPVSDWAKAWCSLNRWEIPDCLSRIKPKWWDEKHDMNTKMEFLKPLMYKIELKIGKKACNREWNKGRMTDEEHELFWKNRGRYIVK